MKVNKTRIGSNGEVLHIVDETDSKGFTIKDAIKKGFAKVSKQEMQKLFSETELKEMGYDYTEDEN